MSEDASGAQFLVEVEVANNVAAGLQEADTQLTGGIDQLLTSIQRLGSGEDAFAALGVGAEAAVAKVAQLNAVVENAVALRAALSDLPVAGQLVEGGEQSVAAVAAVSDAVKSLDGSLSALGDTAGLRVISEESGVAVEGIDAIQAAAQRMRATFADNLDVPLGDFTATNEKVQAGLIATSDAALKMRADLEDAYNSIGVGRAGPVDSALFRPTTPFVQDERSINALSEQIESTRDSQAVIAAQAAAEAERPPPVQVKTGVPDPTRQAQQLLSQGLSSQEIVGALQARGLNASDAKSAVASVTGGSAQSEAFVAAATQHIKDVTLEVAAAEAKAAAATAAVGAAIKEGVTDQAKLNALVIAQVKAENDVSAARGRANATSATGIGGFFTGLGRGIGGGGGKHGNFGGFSTGGGGAEDAGFQIASVAKYIVYYQVFREIETAIRDTIDLTVQYDRATTDLGNRLDVTGAQAKSLAQSLSGIGAPAGLSPAESVQLGTQFAGTFAGQGSPQALATQGAQIGAQLAVLSGSSKDASQDLYDLTAATRAFDLEAAQTPRVLDAATSAAKNFGLASGTDILPGLAQIGDLATAAGMSVEQAANTLADLQSRTGETSAAVAGELQRFFGREGNAAFQQVFSNLGINTLQPFNDELSELSAKYDTLTQKQKDFITAEFGGGRAGVDALGVIQDYQKVQDATNKSVADGGIAQEQYYKRLDDVRGILTQIVGEAKELAVQVGSSGLGAGFGALLETLIPVLKTADDLVGTFNKLVPDPIREVLFAATELYGVLLLIQKIKGANAIENVVGSVKGRPAVEVASGGGAIAGTAEAAAASGEIAAAGAAAGAKIAEAGATEAAAMEGAGVKIAAAGEAAAASVAGAGEALAGAEVASGAEVAAGGFLSRIGGVLGGGLGLLKSIGPVGLGIGGAIAIDSIYRAQSAISSVQTAGAGAGTIDQLQSAANAAGNIAARDRHASSGLVGSTLNFLEGNPTGRASAQAESQVAFDQAAIQRQKDAEDKVGSSAASALVDLSDATDGTNGLAQSIKNLTNAGYTAGEQIDAVVEKLNQASQAAAGYVPPSQFGVIGQQGGTNIAATLRNDIIGGNPLTSLDARRPADQAVLGKINSNEVAQAGGDAITKFLKDNDASGAPLTVKQIVAEKNQVKQAVIANLKKQGLSAKEIADVLPDIVTAVGGSVSGQLAQLAAGVQLSSADVTGIVNSLVPVAQKAGADAGVNAGLAGSDSAGQAQAAANASLAKVQELQGQLQRQKNLTPHELDQLNQDIAQYQLDAQNASIAALQDTAKVAQTAMSPYDKTGQLENALASAKQQLALAPNRPDLQAAVTAAQNNLAQQRLSDANAARDAAVSPGDTTGKDVDALKDAQSTLAAIVASGVKSGTDYSNAVKAVNEASFTLAQQYVDNANAARDAAVDPRDSVGAANAKLQDAQATLANAITSGVTGSALSQDRGAVLQAQVGAEQAAAQNRAEAAKAGAIAGDPLSQANAALAAAQITLGADLKNSTQYFTDLAAVAQQQVNLAQAIAAQAKNAALLTGDATDPVAQAQASLQQAIIQQQQDAQRHVGDATADALSVTQAQQAVQKATLDKYLSTQQTMLQLNEESGATYIQNLQSQADSLAAQLSTMHAGQQGFQQMTDELNQYREAILQASQQFQGQFNLGSIKVPTVYEVRNAIAQQAAGVSAANATSYQQVTFNINGADTAAVKQVISSVLGQAPLSRSGVLTRRVATT